MIMDKIRFGVIGCGGVAQKGFLPAMCRSKSAELVAIASRTLSKAMEFARTFGGEAICGYNDLFRRENIDAVYIATPVGTHAELAVEAARHGKHVLCEKSLALDVQETNRILNSCKEHDVALLEGFMYQFHTQHAALRKLVKEGRVGDPILFQGWFGFPPLDSVNIRYSKQLGGGALLDAGSYTVHAARHFFGREPLNTSAVLDALDDDVEIHGTVLLNFGDGKTAVLAFGFDNFYRNSYSIWGRSGQVTLTRAFSIPPTLSPSLILERQNYREEYILPPCDHFLIEIEAFCAGINDKNTRQQWQKDALGQACTLDLIRRAAEDTIGGTPE